MNGVERYLKIMIKTMAISTEKILSLMKNSRSFLSR